MESRFVMSVTDKKTHETVSFEPGLKVETDFVADATGRVLGALAALDLDGPSPITSGFVEAVVAAVEKRGVGFGRTSAHVLQDLRDALFEVLVTRNPTVHKSVAPAVRQGIIEALLALKAQVRV